MSMHESKPAHAAEDWGVVLQSIPSKNKREILKRLEEIFEIDKHDAEQILSNMPLILVDNLSFGLAARIKKFFLSIGAVTETTNHDMIKKNCFQVLWPQTPDLSFFMKHETGPAEAPVQEKKSKPRPGGFPLFERKDEGSKVNPEMPKLHEAPSPSKPLPKESPVPLFSPPAPAPIQESPAAPPRSPAPAPMQESPAAPSRSPAPVPMKEFPAAPFSPPTPAAPIQKSPSTVSGPPPVSEEKPAAAPASNVDSDWERRATELNEKLRKFHAEKQELHAQHVEAAEKVKNEYQQRLEEEKKKSHEIAKAFEDLQKEAQKNEALSREGEQWRARAMALSEKVRDLETNLLQKTSAVEQMSQRIEDIQKENRKHEALIREGEEWRSKAEALSGKVRELETTLTQKTAAVEQLIQQKKEIFQQSEKITAEKQRELSTLRSHEQELERSVQEMTKSLRSRDDMLAQFEKQITELAEKTKGYDVLRQEHAELTKERATIRQEYEAKLDDREMRLAKAEEDHRRYRSRTDRKNAAAARELGEWIRGMDATRQGLQKLILFLGSESATLESEKKSNLKSPLTRGPDTPSTENS